MTTMHHPPTYLDLMCDAQQNHEVLSREEAEIRAAKARQSVIDDLKERIADRTALMGMAQANGRFGDVGVHLAARAELQQELAEVEAS